MSFTEQIKLAQTLRETLEQLEISALRDNLPEWRDFLLGLLTDRLLHAIQLVGSEAHPYDAVPIITRWEPLSSDGRPYDTLPIITRWESLSYKEPSLDHLKRIMNSRHPLDWASWGAERDNRQVSFPPINGLRLQVKVGYTGEMFWRLAFEDADSFRQAVEHFNLQVDWEAAENAIEKQLAAGRQQRAGLEKLKGAVMPYGKVPEKISLGSDWLLSKPRLKWVYVMPGRSHMWDDETISLEAALRSMHDTNERALYRYVGDGVAVLEKVNSDLLTKS